MVKGLEVKPLMRKSVTKIKGPLTGSMEVTYEDETGAQFTQKYSQVISTVPLGCLQTIDTEEAGLLYSQREAIRSLQYDAATKVGIKFETRWWEDPSVMGGKDKVIRGGQSNTDKPIRVCVYPSYGLDCRGAPGVLLASYTWAQDARRFGSMSTVEQSTSDKDLLKITLENLEKLHQIPRDKFGKVLNHKTHAYYNDSYTRGAFALFGPGQFGTPKDKTSLFASIKAPAAGGRFHIAGEATSVYRAWVLGALNSTRRAVFNALIRIPDKRKELIEK